MPSLAQCLQLEELAVWVHSLREVTQAASFLTGLTRLRVGLCGTAGGNRCVEAWLRECAPL